MGTAVQLLLRSASDKVRRSLLELDAKIEKRGAVAKPAGPPTVLANASVQAVPKLRGAFKVQVLLRAASEPGALRNIPDADDWFPRRRASASDL